MLWEPSVADGIAPEGGRYVDRTLYKRRARIGMLRRGDLHAARLKAIQDRGGASMQ